MSNTLKDVSPNKKIELPVAEEMQMESHWVVEGNTPISIFQNLEFSTLFNESTCKSYR